jgi:cation transport regulator ChaB
MCGTTKFSEMLEDMPDEVREYLGQHCKGAHFGPPGPWIFFGRWGCGPEAGEKAPGDMLDHLLADAPDEVKQWFREHLGQFKSAHFCPPDLWMFWHRPWRHRHGHFCPPGPWLFGYGPWIDEETSSDVPDEVKQWFHERCGDWFKGCPSWAQESPGSPVEEAAG